MSLLIDNWTLQSAGRLLAGGLGGGTASELEVAADLTGFSYKTISEDALNARCLFQVLNHLVFSDSLLVDKDSASYWLQFAELQRLHDSGLVIPKPFQDLRREWLPIRQQFIDEL
jgi:hypothetical protein